MAEFTNPDGIVELHTNNNNARTAKNICKILIKLGVIEKYDPDEHRNAAYDKHQMPFMICFHTAAN